MIVGPGDNGWTKPRAAGWLIEPRSILPALLLPHVERKKIVLEDPPEDVPEEEVPDE